MRYNIAQDYAALSIAEYQYYYGLDYASAKAAYTMDQLLEASWRRKCKAVGHKWVDQSNIGPESGLEAMWCTRCGYTWKHRWY